MYHRCSYILILITVHTNRKTIGLAGPRQKSDLSTRAFILTKDLLWKRLCAPNIFFLQNFHIQLGLLYLQKICCENVYAHQKYITEFPHFCPENGCICIFCLDSILKVFSKVMKYLYAYNIQFGGGLNFGTKHTVPTFKNSLFQFTNRKTPIQMILESGCIYNLA